MTSKKNLQCMYVFSLVKLLERSIMHASIFELEPAEPVLHLKEGTNVESVILN